MKMFFNKVKMTIAILATILSAALALPASAEGTKLMMRDAQSQKILTVRDKHSGAYLGEVLAIETGYGFNSDCNLRGFVAVDRKGNLTLAPAGDCSNSVLGDVLRQGVPAAINAYGAVEAAKALGDRQIDAARATAPDVTNVTATGGDASATGGEAYSYSFSEGGEAFQFQAQEQMTEVQVSSFVKLVNNNSNYLSAYNGCQPMEYKGKSIRKGGCDD